MYARLRESVARKEACMSTIAGISSSAALYRNYAAQLRQQSSVEGSAAEEQNESAAERAAEQKSGGSANVGQTIDVEA